MNALIVSKTVLIVKSKLISGIFTSIYGTKSASVLTQKLAPKNIKYKFRKSLLSKLIES